MKTVEYNVFIILFAMISINCGDSTTTGASNKYLGKLPGIAQAHEQKIEELKSDGKKAATVDEAFAIQQKVKLAKEEVEKIFAEEVKNISFPISIPFEGATKTDLFEVKDFKITGASFNTITFSVKVIPAVDEKTLFAYVHLADAQGKVLPNVKKWCVLAASNFHNVKKGQEIEMKGAYKGLENLETFEKAVFALEEEFNGNR